MLQNMLINTLKIQLLHVRSSIGVHIHLLQTGMTMYKQCINYVARARLMTTE